MIEDRMYSVTLQKLRIFAAVARERSFVKAAESVFLCPPTVSEEIRSLENVVGLKLLNRARGSKSVNLTEAGEILLESFNEMSESMIRAARSLDAIKRLDRGTVTFGTDVIFGGYLLPFVLDSFRRNHPSVKVRSVVDSGERILAELRPSRIELAVLLNPDEEPGLVYEPLAPCYVIPVASPRHPLAMAESVSFRELAGANLLLPDRSARIRKILDRMADEAGVALNVGMEVGNIDANVQAVLSGLGVSILSTHCVASEVSAGHLAVLRVEGFPVRMDWFIIHSRARLTPSAEAMEAHLLETRHKLQNVLTMPAGAR